METREQLPKIELDDLLGNPGTMTDTRAAAEAAIRMQVADLMTIEEFNPKLADESYEQKFENIQNEVIHYVESLQMAEDKGVEGVHIPHIIPDERMVNTMIKVAREDPLTLKRKQSQIEALGLDLDEELVAKYGFVDSIEDKGELYGHDTLHTAKTYIIDLGRRAVEQIVKLKTAA